MSSLTGACRVASCPEAKHLNPSQFRASAPTPLTGAARYHCCLIRSLRHGSPVKRSICHRSGHRGGTSEAC